MQTGYYLQKSGGDWTPVTRECAHWFKIVMNSPAHPQYSEMSGWKLSANILDELADFADPLFSDQTSTQRPDTRL